MNQKWPEDFDLFFRSIQRLIRLELRAAREPQPETIIRVIPPAPQGTRPLFHISDEDGGWLMDQPERPGGA